MKHLKLFEEFNTNDEKDVSLSRMLTELENNIRNCPSTKSLISKIQSIVDEFHVHGKSDEIKKKLIDLQEELGCYSLDDDKYLQKDDKGQKNAPTSSIKKIINLF